VKKTYQVTLTDEKNDTSVVYYVDGLLGGISRVLRKLMRKEGWTEYRVEEYKGAERKRL